MKPRAIGFPFSFCMTARNKCVSGRHRKDKYSFLEKISFMNLPLGVLQNNHARILRISSANANELDFAALREKKKKDLCII